MKFTDLINVATSALSAQGTRLRVVAENIANSSTVNAPGRSRSGGRSSSSRRLRVAGRSSRKCGSARS